MLIIKRFDYAISKEEACLAERHCPGPQLHFSRYKEYVYALLLYELALLHKITATRDGRFISTVKHTSGEKNRSDRTWLRWQKRIDRFHLYLRPGDGAAIGSLRNERFSLTKTNKNEFLSMHAAKDWLRTPGMPSRCVSKRRRILAHKNYTPHRFCSDL